VLRERVVRVEASGVVTEPVTDTRDASPQPADAPHHHPADLVVWATGATPIEFPRHAGLGRLATDEAGFIEVRDTLQAVGFDDVFAVGDCARLVDQRWVPRAGVYAVRQGPILEGNLRARLEGSALRTYRAQRDFLALLNLGDGRALGSKWGHAGSGRLLHRLKDWIDRRFMDRFQVLDVDGSVRPEMARLGAMGDGESVGEPDAMPCGGCAAKLGALPLGAALAALPAPPADDSVLLGLDARDDVGATRDAQGHTTLHNIDVIRAFCDDPYLIGRVAACNALSDLHAKGGTPRHAQAVIGLPEQPPEAAQALLFETLSGLRSVLDAQDVSLLGGHTTLGDELTVGLAVTGEGPRPEQLLRQTGAHPGDELLLCQPIGTGVVLAADMQGRARGDWILAAHRVMQHANDVAGRIARERAVNAATDVTGFGLAGHLLSLLDRAGLVAVLERSAIPLLPGAATLFEQGLRSTAHPANRDAFGSRVQGASTLDEAWLYDPQTAGGLLLAVGPDDSESLCRAFAEAGEPAVRRIGRIAGAEPMNDPPELARAAKGRIEIVP
jgi:selenide,water dikinase